MRPWTSSLCFSWATVPLTLSFSTLNLSLRPLGGLPEGPRAAYVLVHLEDGAFLYNASDGLHYALADPLCPLHTVGLAVTQENVHPTKLHSPH